MWSQQIQLTCLYINHIIKFISCDEAPLSLHIPPTATQWPEPGKRLWNWTLWLTLVFSFYRLTGQVPPGSSSLTRSWHPRFTHSSTVYYTSHGGYQADPWSPMPYLECNLLLPRSWSTPLAIEALLICRPPSSLLPAVRATRSGSPRGGSCPFRSLRSRSACPSLPPRLFFSFPTTVSPSPLLL